MKNTIKALLIGATLYCSVASATVAADWEMYGWYGAGKQATAMFYLSNEVLSRPGYVQVWTEEVRIDKLNAVKLSDYPHIIARTTSKISGTHYMPPLALDLSLNVEQASTIAIWEQIADEHIFTPSLTLFEFNCAQRTSRILAMSGTDFPAQNNWHHLVPHSVSAFLLQITCK